MHEQITNNKLFNEEIVTQYNKYIDNEDITIVVTKDNVPYYNVYRLTERFQNNRLNSLNMQEPMESVKEPLKHFTDAYMIERLMSYIIWDRFYNHGVATVTLKLEFEEIN